MAEHITFASSPPIPYRLKVGHKCRKDSGTEFYLTNKVPYFIYISPYLRSRKMSVPSLAL